MSLGTPAAAARLWNHRRWLAILAVIVAGGAAVAAWSRRGGAEAETPPPYMCVMQEQPTPPEPPAPVRPMPTGDAWSDLERCLARQPIGPGYPARVTVEQVQGWVAEGDPVWFSEGDWWFPISGEGEAQMPSGYYLAAPSCGGAIVN